MGAVYSYRAAAYAFVTAMVVALLTSPRIHVETEIEGTVLPIAESEPEK